MKVRKSRAKIGAQPCSACSPKLRLREQSSTLLEVKFKSAQQRLANLAGCEPLMQRRGQSEISVPKSSRLPNSNRRSRASQAAPDCTPDCRDDASNRQRFRQSPGPASTACGRIARRIHRRIASCSHGASGQERSSHPKNRTSHSKFRLQLQF